MHTTHNLGPWSGNLDSLAGWLLDSHPGSISRDRLLVIHEEVRRVAAWAPHAANIVEIGCHKGAMAAWIRATADEFGRGDLHLQVFDSFEGMPEPSERDSNLLPAGSLKAEPEDVLRTHARWGLKPPKITPGWFENTLATSLPDSIFFCYADGDFYESTLIALREVVPRLAPGAALIVDDYADTVLNPRAFAGLPGVKLACDEYFNSDHPLEVIYGSRSLAYGRYQK